MLRSPLLALPFLVPLVVPGHAWAEEALPDEFRASAYGVWTHLASDVRQELGREMLARALATCGQGDVLTRGTVIMPKGKYVVRANLSANTAVAIAAAKAGRKRGASTPWALATDKGYTAVAFVSRGKGTKARQFMLDETGVYLRCGGLPKRLQPEPREAKPEPKEASTPSETATEPTGTRAEGPASS